MTVPLLRVIRNSFAFRSSNTHFGRHCKLLRSSESRYSEWGIERARGARIGAVAKRVHSVTRSLRYFSVARPTFTIAKEKVTMPENKPFQRLPKHVVPKHYNLELVPNLEKFIFTGKTAVKVSIVNSTKEIVLNCLDLDLKSVELEYKDGGSEACKRPAEVRLSAADETATIVFAEPLPCGEATLRCHFTGEINDKMKGLYRSKYLTPAGEERYAAVTQFEATDARRCFPCWDEPAIKATFDIALEVPADRVALSNMPVSEETVNGDKKIVKFDTTPIMSTYLVAVVVGEYDYVEKKSRDGVLVRVYTPVGKSKQGVFALEVAAKVLPYYKEYFDIAYPLPKIDLIAIADFSAGAMENWGLVTYRETCLLVDEEHTSAVRRQWIALVVGHELAHQWFGNLVTMEWWTHLWLNEGYASFVEFLCVNHLFPEYDIWTQFVTETYIRALELDCLKNSHPIEVPVGHPSEIDEIFDDISYNKGASVIRMLHRYIGDDDFRKGMNIYLTRHQYKNTFTEDLWAALEEASKKPVGAVMSTWTKQMGFPMVQVASEQKGPHRVLTLTQQKFCADGSLDDESLWMIPITVSTQEHPSKIALSTVLDKRTQEVVLENCSESSWVKLNPGTVEYYRTRYPAAMLAQLVGAVRDGSLPPLDRLGLLDDCFALVQAGHTHTAELDLQMSLERGRCPQFYSDMLVMDSQTMNFVALSLNPFDYYIFNFALHLVNNSQQQSTWENWNSVYFALACDYLMHFLPSDPNVPVLPLIPNYTGKVAISAPLQTANRPLHTPTLLLLPDLCGMSSQHTSPQSQSRNEVWRSETVLQVFVDIWMSVEQFNPRDVDLFQRGYQTICSTPERVRTVRVLVKHLHSYSAKHFADPAARSSALRKYARQIICARAYHYVKHLVQTWPLDASFRLVLELWLSLIQPWRYTANSINHDRFPGQNNNQEEFGASILDLNYIQFIAENFPSYTCIFQLMLPRFMRMDLTAYKNAVMLFRLGKVFSQQHLMPILWNLERAMTDCGASIFHSPESSFGDLNNDQSYTYNGISLHKWVAIAKQAISELNMSATFEYDPVWSDNKNQYAIEFVKKIYSAKFAAENLAEEYGKRINQQHKGLLSNIKHWLMIHDTSEDDILLEECKKVPTYLNNCIYYFSNIFGLSESSVLPPEPIDGDSVLEHSSFANSTNFTYSITNKLRSKPTTIQYMGDPDLMPITSYESTILVRILYQISSKINEVYCDELRNVYNKNNLLGFVAREVLEEPRTIRNYVKDISTHHSIVTEELPPRLSLRRLGSYSFVIWISLGYVLFRLFSYSGFTYTFILISLWLIFVFTRAFLKMINIVRA